MRRAESALSFVDDEMEERPKKRSKWADLAAEEDAIIAKERERDKKAQLRDKLAREQTEMQFKRNSNNSREWDDSPSRSTVNSRSSAESTPVRTKKTGLNVPVVDGVRNIRRAHPPLQGCRSVYNYEVLSHAASFLKC